MISGCFRVNDRISEIFVMGTSFSDSLGFLGNQNPFFSFSSLRQWNKAQAPSSSHGKALAGLLLTSMEVISEWHQFSPLNSRKTISLGLQLELHAVLDFIQHSCWSQEYLLYCVTSMGIFFWLKINQHIINKYLLMLGWLALLKLNNIGKLRSLNYFCMNQRPACRMNANPFPAMFLGFILLAFPLWWSKNCVSLGNTVSVSRPSIPIMLLCPHLHGGVTLSAHLLTDWAVWQHNPCQAPQSCWGCSELWGMQCLPAVQASPPACSEPHICKNPI